MKKLITILSLVSTISTLGATARAAQDAASLQKQIAINASVSATLDKVKQGKSISKEEAEEAQKSIIAMSTDEQQDLIEAIADIEQNVASAISDDETKNLTSKRQLLVDRLNEVNEGTKVTVEKLESAIQK